MCISSSALITAATRRPAQGTAEFPPKSASLVGALAMMSVSVTPVILTGGEFEMPALHTGQSV